MTVNTKTRTSGDVTIVDITGRATLGGGATVFSETLRSLAAAGNKKLLLNLAELSYIDSSGLGELVASLTIVTKDGGTLKLLNPTARVKELLKITRVNSLFQIFEDEAAAVKSFV